MSAATARCADAPLASACVCVCVSGRGAKSLRFCIEAISQLNTSHCFDCRRGRRQARNWIGSSRSRSGDSKSEFLSGRCKILPACRFESSSIAGLLMRLAVFLHSPCLRWPVKRCSVGPSRARPVTPFRKFDASQSSDEEGKKRARANHLLATSSTPPIATRGCCLCFLRLTYITCRAYLYLTSPPLSQQP